MPHDIEPQKYKSPSCRPSPGWNQGCPPGRPWCQPRDMKPCQIDGAFKLIYKHVSYMCVSSSMADTSPPPRGQLQITDQISRPMMGKPKVLDEVMQKDFVIRKKFAPPQGGLKVQKWPFLAFLHIILQKSTLWPSPLQQVQNKNCFIFLL